MKQANQSRNVLDPQCRIHYVQNKHKSISFWTSHIRFSLCWPLPTSMEAKHMTGVQKYARLGYTNVTFFKKLRRPQNMNLLCLDWLYLLFKHFRLGGCRRLCPLHSCYSAARLPRTDFRSHRRTEHPSRPHQESHVTSANRVATATLHCDPYLIASIS